MEIGHPRIAYWIPKATSTHTHSEFSLAAMVARTPLIVAVYLQCLSCVLLPTLINNIQDKT